MFIFPYRYITSTHTDINNDNANAETENKYNSQQSYIYKNSKKMTSKFVSNHVMHM